jgi:hypothetical protein
MHSAGLSAVGTTSPEGCATLAALCLDWVAAMAGATGRAREGAVLFGAAEAQWQVSGAVRYAPERAQYAAEVRSVRAELGDMAFEAAWTEGRAMSRDEAVDYALKQTER